MDRAEWSSTADALKLIRFACLRIPRRHLVLVLSGIVEAALDRELLDAPWLDRERFAVAALRAWCFHELTDDALRAVLREFELEPRARTSELAEAVQLLLCLALWEVSEPEPGLSWGVEQRPEEFAQHTAMVFLLCRDVFGPAMNRPVARELADAIRRRVAFPEGVERDWLPSFPLIIAGTQVLTVVDWDILSAVPVDDAHGLDAEALVQRDQLLAAAAPETLEQRAERQRVEAIFASRAGRPAQVPSSFRETVEHVSARRPLTRHVRARSVPAPSGTPPSRASHGFIILGGVGLLVAVTSFGEGVASLRWTTEAGVFFFCAGVGMLAVAALLGRWFFPTQGVVREGGERRGGSARLRPP